MANVPLDSPAIRHSCVSMAYETCSLHDNRAGVATGDDVVTVIEQPVALTFAEVWVTTCAELTEILSMILKRRHVIYFLGLNIAADPGGLSNLSDCKDKLLEFLDRDDCVYNLRIGRAWQCTAGTRFLDQMHTAFENHRRMWKFSTFEGMDFITRGVCVNRIAPRRPVEPRSAGRLVKSAAKRR